jgi:hypothetical protein
MRALVVHRSASSILGCCVTAPAGLNLKKRFARPLSDFSLLQPR